MQLVAYGAQDIYLTGNPQITFFKVVYRRHTNFSMEYLKQSSTGGNTTKTWTISRNGDLILDMFLENMGNLSNITMNMESDVLDFPSASYDYLITNLMNAKLRYTLEIGGQTIDRFSERYRNIHNGLFEFNPTNESSIINTQRMKQVGIFNMPFWFCRNPGCALPLIALQYHEVKFIMDGFDTYKQKIQDIFSLAYKTNPDLTVPSTRPPTDTDIAAAYELDPELWVTYVYLDTDERRRFAQVSHEYLIEQIQTYSGKLENNVELNFNHPVKELMWIFTNSDSQVYNQAPVREKIMTSFLNVWGKHDTIGLQLNGQDRFTPRHPTYFNCWQVDRYHTGYGNMFTNNNDYTYGRNNNLAALTGQLVSDPENKEPNLNVLSLNRGGGNIFVYSFALKPEEHQPSGTCNFSRIDNAVMNFNFQNKINVDDDNYGLWQNVEIYAKNYNVLRIMSGMGGLAYSN